MASPGLPTFSEPSSGRLSAVAAATVDPPGAVLVHCTAGKDRTGVATALILDAVGVEREAIVADYATSQKNLEGPWEDGMLAVATSQGVPVTDQLRQLVAGTPPAAIEQAFAWLDERGGSQTYLRSGELTPQELEALIARFCD